VFLQGRYFLLKNINKNNLYFVITCLIRPYFNVPLQSHIRQVLLVPLCCVVVDCCLLRFFGYIILFVSYSILCSDYV
jgi:hypothetical protein